MSKFGVGDIVRVKKFLNEIPLFFHGYTDHMQEWEGKLVRIRKVVDLGEGYNVETLGGEHIPFDWDPRAFTKVTICPSSGKYKVGDLVIGNDVATELYRNNYTTKGWVGRVVDVYDKWIDVEGHCFQKGINGDRTSTCYDRFTVNPEAFDLLDKEKSQAYKFGIKKVIFNKPATIVIWTDDTKTVVKIQDGDKFSKELGLAMCIAKKHFGNKGNYNEVFKQFCKEGEQ